LKGIFKLSLALGLIYWLLQSGKLDFKLLQKAFNSPMNIIIAIIIMQFDHILVAFRLRLLIQIKAQEQISFIKLFLANWIGIFFNSVLPGAVTGDLVKIFYIKDLDKNLTKKYLLLSVFTDRVIGLLGLVTISGVFSLVNYSNLVILSNEVKTLIHINLSLFLVVILVLICIFFFQNIPLMMARPFENMKYIGGLFRKLKSLWTDICLFKNIIFKVLGLSIVIQVIAIFIFWFLTHPYAEGNFTLATAFTVMPIGFISLAIPIAPAGLGVGHVVFEKLLGFFAITNGASLFNIYFFVIMISNLTGVIPYLAHSSKGNIHLKEIEDELN
jgi:uncharacterized membrane protein YbhN (UPF0104 family)